MLDVLTDALKDTLVIVPWLFAVYAALELFERKFEHRITDRLSHAANAGPFLGAIFGCFPHGFSVLAAALYMQRYVTRGTLLAIFLSTSDEAIPVILAQKGKAHLVFGLILTKVLIAMLAGYTVDLVSKRKARGGESELHDPRFCKTDHEHCCGRDHSCTEPWWKAYLIYPFLHTMKIASFILAVSAGIGLLIAGLGEKNFEALFLAHTVFQPFVTVLVGLIPNCAASVAITQIYLKGGITFGSAIAGLCVSTSFGMLVLIKENKDRRDTLLIAGLLVGISLLSYNLPSANLRRFYLWI